MDMMYENILFLYLNSNVSLITRLRSGEDMDLNRLHEPVGYVRFVPLASMVVHHSYVHFR